MVLYLLPSETANRLKNIMNVDFSSRFVFSLLYSIVGVNKVFLSFFFCKFFIDAISRSFMT